MRKLIVLSLVGLFILAFGSIGYSQQLYEVEPDQYKAMPGLQGVVLQPGSLSTEKAPALEFKASGSIDVISEYNRNTNDVSPSAWTGTVANTQNVTSTSFLFGISPQFQPRNAAGNITAGQSPGLQDVRWGAAFNKTQNFMATRARLRFDAIMGKQVTGTVFFEIDAVRWGERWGMAAQRNQAGDWNADAAAVEVKNAFISFAVPPIVPVPITISGGILPFVTRPVTNYTDGCGMQIAIKPDPAQITFKWGKAYAGQDWASDGGNVYGMETKVNLGTITVAGWFSYYNLNTYPFMNAPSYGAIAGTWTTVAGYNSAYNTTYVANNTADFSWWGLYADGKLGPFGLCFDFVYDTGKVAAHGDRLAQLNTMGVATKVDYSGYILRLGLDYPVERFNFGATGMYASGANMQRASTNGLPGEVNMWGATKSGYASNVNSYIVPPNAEHVYDDESIVFYGTGANGLGRPGSGFNTAGGASGSSIGRGNYGGTWFAKLYGNYKPTPWYRVTLYGMYIGDTTKNGDSLGTSVQTTGVNKGYPKDDSSIGWELGLFNDIQIYRNLQFRIGAGIMFPGNAFTFWDQRATINPAQAVNVTPSNLYSVISKLIFIF